MANRKKKSGVKVVNSEDSAGNVTVTISFKLPEKKSQNNKKHK